MQKLSVIIITLNEEKNIGRTLDAAFKVADELIVVDSGSKDSTREICLSKGVTFIHEQWAGYGQQRNNAVAKAANDYMLSLDADEVLDDQLIASILQLKATGFAEKTYSVKRKNFYFGKFITHGMEGIEIKPRLYHRDFAKWNNKLVHETLEYSSSLKTPVLPGYLLHYTYNTVSDYILKSDKYSELAALEYYKNGKASPGIVKLILSPAFTFFNAYFIKAGFLDGWHGWILAKMQANYVLQKYSKLKMIYLNAGKSNK